MIPVPKIFRNTKSVRRINEYMDNTFDEVLHTTLNPDGPGAIRIHLVPPKREEGALNPSAAIINGMDIVPVNFAWAVMLTEMIRETNKYDGRQIGESDIHHKRTGPGKSGICLFFNVFGASGDLAARPVFCRYTPYKHAKTMLKSTKKETNEDTINVYGAEKCGHT